MSTVRAALASLAVAAALTASLATPVGARAEDDAPRPGAPLGETRPDGGPRAARTPAAAAEPRVDRSPAGTLPYRTPRAGEAFHTSVFGEDVALEARQRSDVLSVTLGLQAVTPNVGGRSFLPIGAIYARQHWMQHRRRIRAIIAGVVNDASFEDGTWNDLGFEFIANWRNDTIPVATTEVVSGSELEGSDLRWGQLVGGLGFGWRMPLRPFQFENSLQLQVLYELGYFYTDEVSDTDPNADLPPDTPLHQLHVKLRADGFERNLMELIHEGFGFGGDLVLGVRQNWDEFGATNIDNVVLRRADENDEYLRLSGYAAIAGGPPFVSERHRVIASIHAGWSPSGNADRFSAFRKGGGPSNTQDPADLARSPFPGALIEAVPMERYALATLEYRYEALFFVFLHFRATFARARIPILKGDGEIEFDDETSWGTSVGVTSGLPFYSQIYLEYSYTSNGFLRGEDGHGFLVVWSKAF